MQDGGNAFYGEIAGRGVMGTPNVRQDHGGQAEQARTKVAAQAGLRAGDVIAD